MLPGEIRIIPYYPHDNIVGQLENIYASLMAIRAEYRAAVKNRKDNNLATFRAEISREDLDYLMDKTLKLTQEFKALRMEQVSMNRYILNQTGKADMKSFAAAENAESQILYTVSEGIPEDVPENTAQEAPKDILDDMPENTSGNNPHSESAVQFRISRLLQFLQQYLCAD